MPISDLTGTTWRFDTTVLTPASSAVEYNLIGQYHIAGNDYYISDEYGDTQPGVIRAPSANRIFGWTGYNEAIEQSGTTGEWRVYSYEDHETIVDWTDYFDITIDGGIDVTNANLIAWVEQHATQQGGSQLSVDLSTLSGWSNVSSGSHTLKVKAKATGYQDSALSEGASFTKAGSGYTGTVLTTGGYMEASIYIDRIPTEEEPDYSMFGNETQSFSCSEYFYILDWIYDVQYVNSFSGCTYERVNGQTFSPGEAYGYKVFPTENGWTFDARFED